MPVGILEQIDARLGALEHAVLTIGDAVRTPTPPVGMDPSEWADGALSAPAAAVFCGISESELYKLMGRGELPFTHHGVKRLLPRRVLVRWLESRPVERTERATA